MNVMSVCRLVGWLVSRLGHGSVAVLLEHLMTSFKGQRKKVLRGTIDAQLRAKTVERTDRRTQEHLLANEQRDLWRSLSA